jgi:hypothetical protein
MISSFYIEIIIFPILIFLCIILFYAADKLEQAEGQLAHSRFGGMLMPSQRKKEVCFCMLSKLSSVFMATLGFCPCAFLNDGAF